jgi:Zn-finger nucleic acid-binding protein
MAETDESVVLKCPKCFADMEKVHFDQFVVDRCTACKGLWFGMLEREHLAELKNAESIDTGSSDTQKRDVKATVKCPECHAQMIRMVDHRKPQIHFESCPVCYGVFYDAGEFREYKAHHVIDFFRGIFHRKK